MALSLPCISATGCWWTWQTLEKVKVLSSLQKQPKVGLPCSHHTFHINTENTASHRTQICHISLQLSTTARLQTSFKNRCFHLMITTLEKEVTKHIQREKKTYKYSFCVPDLN